ncbi:hypothetical protein Bbelb_391380 [Branchiostoma belcheri]|nr:hypothetical protein Bbelb_391380 [Branchiostoma belcheri]
MNGPWQSFHRKPCPTGEFYKRVLLVKSDSLTSQRQTFEVNNNILDINNHLRDRCHVNSSFTFVSQAKLWSNDDYNKAMFERDGYHLNSDGVRVLAYNIKKQATQPLGLQPRNLENTSSSRHDTKIKLPRTLDVAWRLSRRRQDNGGSSWTTSRRRYSTYEHPRGQSNTKPNMPRTREGQQGRAPQNSGQRGDRPDTPRRDRQEPSIQGYRRPQYMQAPHPIDQYPAGPLPAPGPYHLPPMYTEWNRDWPSLSEAYGFPCGLDYPHHHHRPTVTTDRTEHSPDKDDLKAATDVPPGKRDNEHEKHELKKNRSLSVHCRPSANVYSSAIFHHLQHSQGHSFKLESTDVLDRETRWWERDVKEAIYERMYNPTLNREGGLRVDLSDTWDLALPAPRTDNTPLFRLPKIWAARATSMEELQSSSMEVARTALQDTPAELYAETTQFASSRNSAQDCSLNTESSAPKEVNSLVGVTVQFCFHLFALSAQNKAIDCKLETDGARPVRAAMPALRSPERKEVKAKLNCDANQRIDLFWRRTLRVSQTDGELSEQSCAELHEEGIRADEEGIRADTHACT